MGFARVDAAILDERRRKSDHSKRAGIQEKKKDDPHPLPMEHGAEKPQIAQIKHLPNTITTSPTLLALTMYTYIYIYIYIYIYMYI